VTWTVGVWCKLGVSVVVDLVRMKYCMVKAPPIPRIASHCDVGDSAAM
jgi:hypothetical protein